MSNTRTQAEIAPYDYEAAHLLERELGIGHVTAQVLVRRGITTPEGAREWMDAKVKASWRQFEQIDTAIELIRGRIDSGAKITIHGDYDADGVCATALLLRALRRLDANVDWFLPSRFEQGYGIARETIDLLAKRGTGLLISVDCGITAVEEVEYAKQLGMDVVVTDHHMPREDGALPATPIVHPVVNNYPTAALCGTAVAYKLVEGLESGSRLDGAVGEDLDLVAIATIADLMPLLAENRWLVRQGLSVLANTDKPGLRALMEIARVEPSRVGTDDVGFRLAPRLNAAGRMNHADAALELLLTEGEQRAGEIAKELHAANAQRRDSEQQIVKEATAQVKELGDRFGYVVAAEGWHKGVVGIVASRLADKTNRPVIVIALEGDEGSASGRAGVQQFDLLAALNQCASYLLTYGGHKAAAGLTLKRDQLEQFQAAFAQVAEQQLEGVDLSPSERVDAVVSGSELTLETADELASLGPFGQGNPPINLLVAGGKFRDPVGMGEGRHLRFTLESGGARVSAVRFGAGDRPPVSPDQSVDAIFRLERNEWNGNVDARVTLRSICAAVTNREITSPVEPLNYAIAVSNWFSQSDLVPAQLLQGERVQVDQALRGPLATLVDLVSSGERVLAVCAHREQRLQALGGLVGGFDLVSYEELEAAMDLLEQYRRVVAIDPPLCAEQVDLLTVGTGFVHCAWGESETEFSDRVRFYHHELRPHLAEIFKAASTIERIGGEELTRLLKGTGRWERSPFHAAIVLRVLTELELVSFDPAGFEITVISQKQTDLSHSNTYQAYHHRYKEGLKLPIEQTETVA